MTPSVASQILPVMSCCAESDLFAWLLTLGIGLGLSVEVFTLYIGLRFIREYQPNK